ncbi:MAG: acetoacetate decarboxylase family protein [Pseudobacteriovorax sp.]|nr:acetoacetate decarboxylase family protein [Pseudobacteriovorax sp.]
MNDTWDISHESRAPGKVAPAPWSLTGQGHIILSFGKKKANLRSAEIPTGLIPSYLNLINVSMFVDYQSSPVGPYRELLFIPGFLNFPEVGRHLSITKIYVDSVDSTWNGRRNWGIPKEMASFSLTRNGSEETVTVASKASSFASYRLKPFGPKIPLHLGLVSPYFRTFGELLHQMLYLYTFSGKGRIQLAKFDATPTSFDQERFPDLFDHAVVLALKVTDFQLRFPMSRVIKQVATMENRSPIAAKI